MNEKGGTIYVDLTGKFPILSMGGMVAIFIVCNWIMNAILATPVNNMKWETIVEFFNQNIYYLLKMGFKPVLNTIDNVASKAVHAYLEKKNVGFQLVKPHNHQVNKSER